MEQKKENVAASDFSPAGTLVFLDLWGVGFDILNDGFFLGKVAKQAAEKAGMNVLDVKITPFDPQGISLLLTLSQSHLSLHSTPELHCCNIDIFTCGGGNPLVAAEHLLDNLKPEEFSLQAFCRGIKPQSLEEIIQKIFQLRMVRYALR
jgi:S-adenosylmethionine decarboxylase